MEIMRGRVSELQANLPAQQSVSEERRNEMELCSQIVIICGNETDNKMLPQ